jgi:hypothetical protein
MAVMSQSISVIAQTPINVTDAKIDLRPEVAARRVPAMRASVGKEPAGCPERL